MMVFWCLIAAMTLLAAGFICIPLWQESRSIAAVIGIALMLVAIILYWHWGSYDKLREAKIAAVHDAAIKAEIAKLGSLDNVITQLKQKVTAHPDSRGWYLLGRLYLRAGQPHDAVLAFRQANQLSPDQAEIMIGYAQALYFDQHLVLSTQAKSLINRALQFQPNQPDAINLLATNAYQHKNYAQAIRYWQQLLPLFQAGSEEERQVLEMIAAARQKNVQ